MKHAFIVKIFLTFLIIGISAQSAHGFYKWIDDKGQLHVTDYPPPAQYAPKEESEPAEEPVRKEAPALVPAPLPREKQAAPPAPPTPPATVTAPPAPAVLPMPSAPSAAPAAKPSPPAPQAPPVTSAPAPASTPGATMPPKTAPGPAAPAPGTPIPISPAPPQKTPSVPKELLPAAELVGALLGGWMMTIVGVVVGFYLFFSLCLFKIAKKLDVESAWAAWVPILQVWPFLASAGKPIWWVILLLLPLVNVFIGIYLWMSISGNLGKGKPLGLLMVLPFVNLIVLGYLAFSEAE